MTTWSVDTELE